MAMSAEGTRIFTSHVVTHMEEAGDVRLVTTVIGSPWSSKIRATPRLLRTWSDVVVLSRSRQSRVAKSPPGEDLFKHDLIFWKVRSGESPCELEVRRVIKR